MLKKAIIFLIFATIALPMMAGCKTKSPKVTVIGNSSSQEKVATPSATK